MWKLRDNLRFSGKGNKMGFAGGLEAGGDGSGRDWGGLGWKERV